MGADVSDIINRYKTASEICSALGLDPRQIHSLHIILDESMPRIEIVMPLTSDKGGLLSNVLKSYAIVDKSEC